jgi:carboxymethylenebutenolidase
MGQTIQLTAADRQRISAYLAEPEGQPRGGLVVIQEIFGVNHHIRAVTDEFAAQGYLSLAPALFDRVEPNVDVPYTDMQRGFSYMQRSDMQKAMLDIGAAVERVRSAGKVAVVGFCWGGTLAYLASARLKVDAAVCYYGGGIDQHLNEKPKVPVLFHYGEKDSHIPLTTVAKVKEAVPQGVFFTYPGAEHGFNCSERGSYAPASAKLAFERTLEFLHRQVG